MLLALKALLAGRKTYLVALVAAVLNFCVAVGWVSPDHLPAINALLGSLGLAALRNAVN